MSRSFRRPTYVGLCSLLLALLLFASSGPWLEQKAQAAVENVREQFLGPPVGPGDNVYQNKMLAQSFTAQSNYLFTRAELFIKDIGNDDSLDMTLQRDNGNPANPGPSDIPLSNATADGPNGFTWVSFVLDTPIMVNAGSIYWLVLDDPDETNPNGYQWGKRDVPPTYTLGLSADCTGSSCTWSSRTDLDYLFINYGISDPSISASLEVDSLTAGAGDPLQYTITFENVGVEVASRVWINMSLSGDLAYVSDDAHLVNGLHNPFLHWMFLNVGVGITYDYHVNVSVALNVKDGTLLTANITLQYSNDANEMQEDHFFEVTSVARVPSLSLDKVAVPDHTTKNSTITYRITFQNSGSRASAKVWVNDTLPDEVTYVNDSAANGTMPGNTTSVYNSSWSQGKTHMYNFSNVVPGTYIFEIIVRINEDVENGTAFTNVAVLHYADSSNRTCGPITSSAVARVDGASIQIEVYALQNSVSPGDELTYLVVFNNVGTIESASVWINITLPAEVTFNSDTAESITQLSNASRIGQNLRYLFIRLPVGAYNFFIRTQVNSGTIDGQILTMQTCLNYTDWDSHLLLPSSTQVSSIISLPIFSMQVQAPSTVDPGDVVTYEVVLNNTGSGFSQSTWISIIEAPEITHTFDNTSLNGGVWEGLQKWSFKDLSPGKLFLGFIYSIDAGLPDGYQISTTFELNYTDYKGRHVDFIQIPVQFVVTAPNMTLEVYQDKDKVPRGNTITYTIFYNNTGSGTSANVWINDTIPEGTVFYRSSEQYIYSSGVKFTWHFTNVAPGSYNMTVTVSVETTTIVGTNLTNLIQLSYDDANRNSIDKMSMQTLTEVLDGVQPPPPDIPTNPESLLWAAVVSLIAILLLLWLFVARKFYGLGIKNKAMISELFLLHRSGELIRHHSRNLRPNVDSDLLSAMLVAVQNFVKESFNFREGDLEELKFGDEKIILIHGQHVILAAVIDGPFPQRKVPVMRKSLEEIDNRFGPVLDKWSGLTEDLPKIDDVLSNVFEEKAG